MKTMKARLMTMCVMAVMLAVAGTAGAAEWTVNPGDNIQAVIDGAAPTDTVIISQGTYNLTSQLTVPKSLTIRGASGANQPTLQFSDGAYDGVSVRADDVTVENLRIYRDGHTSYNSLLSVPKGGSYPDYTVEYSGATLSNMTFEGGRYGVYTAPDDLTVENCTFTDNYRDSIVLIGGSGTNTITGNSFSGGSDSKKAILVEPASGPPSMTGTLNIEYNTLNGKRNFLVFNHWTREASDTMDINVVHNTVYGTPSGVVVLYAAYTDATAGLEQLDSVSIRDNLFSNTGTAVYVDYEDWGGAPPIEDRSVAADGLIDVSYSLCNEIATGANDTTDATGSFGYYDTTAMTPSGASMDMFALSNNSVGDPKFVDTTLGDFRLLVGSPALNAASDGTHIGAYQGAPVPEPATMSLLALGGLAVLRRRRNRK